MALSVTLLATSIVVVAVLLVALPRLGSPGSFTLFLRFAAASAVAAVGASVLYLVYGGGGGGASLAFGDLCMVLAPLLLFVAVRALDDRPVLGSSVLACGTAVAVATVTTLAPVAVAMPIKVAVLAIACGLCAWVAARSNAEPWSAMRTIALTTAAYAVFSIVRGLIAVLTGWGSSHYDVAFSFVPTTVVGTIAVVAVGVAVVQLARARDQRSSSQPGRPAGAIVVVGDWRLASAAYGADRVRQLVNDLREAARTLDPDAADVPRGVEVAVPHPVAAVSKRLRETYGWTADEIALLADASAAGAIRTYPVPTRGWSRRRPPRT